MSITSFFTTTFTIKRMVYTANKSALQTAGTFNGYIQQLSQQKLQEIAGALKVSHAIWCAVDTVVNLGDVLEVGTNKYAVKAIQTNNTGGNQHLELLVEK
ncbi:MAG: hypothetical protein UW68_C0026G0012 [Candidatus Collierbacteria bacterium GW2011_GWB1_44_6]|uniref:Phage protein n=1 Tax=Candidatus Collierbacteria bacterium GW2011_GWB1_44_6 TaxID=1618384 RepID=A0A0G1JN14_9BACT|nr:MAG: hypothetical protein UW68_C0026G0012 [Candidatus Collierbacteria bacterium GW2011_GWB1_44_6]